MNKKPKAEQHLFVRFWYRYLGNWDQLYTFRNENLVLFYHIQEKRQFGVNWNKTWRHFPRNWHRIRFSILCMESKSIATVKMKDDRTRTTEFFDYFRHLTINSLSNIATSLTLPGVSSFSLCDLVTAIHNLTPVPAIFCLQTRSFVTFIALKY